MKDLSPQSPFNNLLRRKLLYPEPIVYFQNLSKNDIGRKGLILLEEAMDKNLKLKELNLSGKKFKSNFRYKNNYSKIKHNPINQQMI